ncbi:MAG: DMT family transporter [Pseudomonadota bacterium]
MTADTEMRGDSPNRAIACMVFAAVCISVNDMLIKALSGDYPLHQIVFTRSAIGIGFSLALLQFEGGWRALRTATPGLHLLRGLLVVLANMLFYAALAVMPLADTTATFYVAPLLITLLSVPLLGETVGPRRLMAVAIGFLGVLVIVRPWAAGDGSVDRVLYVLPLLSALAYAGMQLLTRKLGVSAGAAAMAIYLQLTFISVSALFFLVAGDGRFAEGLEDPSLIFLLRAWTWPAAGDWALFLSLGLASAGIAYTLSQAYRSADAATVAPFEYAILPLSVFWGWAVFGHLPGVSVLLGIALIAGAGLYVFLRERVRERPLASRRPQRRP